ncbi:MAG: quinone-dependent dihydroorotate dehydrogenase [Alphaproteobacteria bacterium]|nr:quinone-dependent dihydroorotate dehydrogenase [Alphaproteobacteria bacterium]
MSVLVDLAAKALRHVDPETAHRAAIAGLKTGVGPRVAADRWPVLKTTLAGLALPNPIGLAAGFDKDAEAPDALLAAGFGFVECGTATPRPQDGNPKPRLFRLPEDRAVINRMGFNNRGLEAFCANLAAQKRAGVVGANVGANKDAADRAADYVIGVERVWALASYVTINISSPNTPGLRGLQEKGALDDLLGRVRAAGRTMAQAHGPRPVFLKVAPDLDDAAISDIAGLAVAHGLDALIVSNTTIDRSGALRGKAKTETGGLSGRPLFTRSTGVLRSFAAELRGKPIALIGAGGVENGATALGKIKAGASAVQLYTALAYEGPGLVRRIARDLAMRLRAEGFASVADAVGVDRE